MAASEEPKFPFGNLLKDRPRAMLAAFGRRRLLEADERSSCALLGYEQGQLTSRGLNDLADLTVGQWSAALPGQEEKSPTRDPCVTTAKWSRLGLSRRAGSRTTSTRLACFLGNARYGLKSATRTRVRRRMRPTERSWMPGPAS